MGVPHWGEKNPKEASLGVKKNPRTGQKTPRMVEKTPRVGDYLGKKPQVTLGVRAVRLAGGILN